MSVLPGVSIVIPCYNHAQFVGLAIESALAQDHPRCEVIVVDDCSTDDSRRVIERFTDRVRAVFLPSNRRQVAALNEAWPLAQHEIVIFLDSDDTLESNAASTIAQNWSPAVAKLQFPMKSIDADGRSLNHVSPKYPAEVGTDTLRQQLLTVGQSHCTPGSGNAYSKWFLERISPIGGLQWMDTLLEIHAPFNGEVKTLTMPLVCYRMHGSNWSQHDKLHVDRFASHLQYYEDKLTYLSSFANGLGLAFDPQAARIGSPWYLQCLIAAARLSAPGHRWHVSPLRVVGRSWKGLFRSPYGFKARVTVLLWITLVAVLPQRWAERLVELRFVIGSRPKWLEPVVSRLSS
jgi:glycosyltransferase involved in cell wall biosynthesis